MKHLTDSQFYTQLIVPMPSYCTEKIPQCTPICNEESLKLICEMENIQIMTCAKCGASYERP